MNPFPLFRVRQFSLAGLFICLLLLFSTGKQSGANSSAIGTPVLKWQNGGCYSSWCETGWYSSPAVADLDNDGRAEVIASPYTLFVLNGEDGTLQWSVDPPGSRTWPGVITADIDNDGDLEVGVAQGNGYVTVYDHLGNLVWSRRPEQTELRGLSAYDLDNDGMLELVVTATGDERNSYLYEHDGSLRNGWPQLSNDSGYGWGVYNDNAALGDLDSDGEGEIVIPSDVHYINAYEINGTQIPAHGMYGDKGWGQVGIWESLEIEQRGWGRCNGVRAESYRTNFADGPGVIADVNGDGVHELVVTGNVYDCDAGYPPSRYTGVYIFNADRSRFNSGGFNWETVPVDTGTPLSENYNVIESAQANPVVADLDGDGRLEILFAGYDGLLHAFWLDKTERHNWPFNVHATGAGIRFASEPVVADLDNDGKAEVIFTSWPEKGVNLVGQLHILDYQGNPLHTVQLPAPYGSPDWNGAMAAPTIANIDADADFELVLNTAHSGVVAYDLPGSAGARILWGTGRGNFQRSGSFLQGDLRGTSLTSSEILPAAGGTFTLKLAMRNPGPELTNATAQIPLPSALVFAGNLTADSGNATFNNGTVRWEGDVPAGTAIVIMVDVTVDAGLNTPQKIVVTAEINDGMGTLGQRQTAVVANGEAVFLPLILRDR